MPKSMAKYAMTVINMLIRAAKIVRISEKAKKLLVFFSLIRTFAPDFEIY